MSCLLLRFRLDSQGTQRAPPFICLVYTWYVCMYSRRSKAIRRTRSGPRAKITQTKAKFACVLLLRCLLYRNIVPGATYTSNKKYILVRVLRLTAWTTARGYRDAKQQQQQQRQHHRQRGRHFNSTLGNTTAAVAVCCRLDS